MIRVLMGDENPNMLQAIKAALEDTEDIRVSGIAEDGRDLLGLAGHYPFDVILSDLRFADIPGLEIVRRLRRAAPHLPVLVISVHDELEYELGAREAGASGFVSTERGPTELLAAIRAVSEGDEYFHCATESNHLH